MIDYTFQGVKITLVRKKKGKKDEYENPIYWRITYRRKQVYYFTGFKFDKAEWDDFLNHNLKKHKETKESLQKYFELTLRPIVDQLAANNSFSFEEFENNLYCYGYDQKVSVNKTFKFKIDTLESQYKIGNASIYKATFNSLLRFKHYMKLSNSMEKQKFIEDCIKKKHKAVGKERITVDEEIYFDEITPKFLIDCENFWRKVEITDATIGLYMRTFRSLINNKEGEKPYINEKHYPFGTKGGKYVIPEGGRREISLSIEDIWKIEDYETDNPQLMLAKDIFAFMFYCNGLNFGDLCRLRFENINAATGEIVFQRKKTLRKGEKPTFIYAPMLPPMVEIINRQGNKEQDGYIFPILNGIEPSIQNERKIKDQINLALEPINSSLKQIATALELDPNISTSYTRNSYISYLVSEMYVNPIIVKKMVGHSTKKDVTAGYVNITPKKRREINSKLLNPEKRYTTINSGSVILE